MFPISEQFSTASKAQLNAQLTLLGMLSSKAFESVEKIVGLNIDAAKASLEESNAAVKQFLTVQDPQEWLSLSAAYTQPNTEKALAYGRHLFGIASGAQAEFSKAAETQIAETSRKMLELVEEIARNAPAGSETVFTFVKSAIGTANAGYEQLSKTGKQAVDTVQTNLNTAAGQFAQAVGTKANGRAARK